MSLKHIFISLLLLCFFLPLSGQKPPETKEEFEAAYQKRIQQDYLYGVYIPKDLTDVFVELNKRIAPGDQQKFKELPEEIATRKLFFSLGRWITHNWGFYGGSRLSHYLRELGITHPEDQALFIILTYHRNLNRSTLQVKELVTEFQEKRQQAQEERMKEGTILFEETRKREKEGEGQ